MAKEQDNQTASAETPTEIDEAKLDTVAGGRLGGDDDLKDLEVERRR